MALFNSVVGSDFTHHVHFKDVTDFKVVQDGVV